MYKDKNYYKDWDFSNANTKEYSHIYHAYPAMMIPQIARRLIKEFSQKEHSILFDPYCGSGTSLVEGILNGLHSFGTDINPLARLIASVKTSKFDLITIKNSFEKIVALFEKNHDSQGLTLFENNSHEITFSIHNFDNIDFWFSENVKRQLSLLKEIIFNHTEKDVRDFFLLPFSETVREASFTRNSEFKLFRIKEEKRKVFNPDVLKIFAAKVKRNIGGLESFLKKFKNNVNSEVFNFNTCVDSPVSYLPEKCDLIVTSPPYGDSRTTVAYGQYSRLSSQWLNLPNPNKVDNNLMGGTKYDETDFIDLTSCNHVLSKIKESDNKRYFEVQSFILDYYKSIKNISDAVKENSYVCYVLGNRTVKGEVIPLDKITSEIFQEFGFSHYNTFKRNIPNKRMPSKNSPTNQSGKKGNTMTNEYIVIMKK